MKNTNRKTEIQKKQISETQVQILKIEIELLEIWKQKSEIQTT